MNASRARGSLLVLLALCVTPLVSRPAGATPPPSGDVTETFQPAVVQSAVPPTGSQPLIPPSPGLRPAAAENRVTTLPLPAGFYVGLMGLASAAVARRRYLKRR